MSEKSGWGKAGSVGWSLFKRYITPFPTLMRQGKETKASVDRSIEAFRELRRKNKERQEKKLGQDYSNLPPEDKFERMYKVGQWDEESLAIQSGKIRVAKFVLLTTGLCLIPVQAAIYFLLPGLLLSFLAPLMFLFNILVFVKALRHAHWAFQIENRSLVSFKSFMRRGDYIYQLFS